MGFLRLASGFNMNKAVVSVWFRIPQASATAASTDALPSDPGVMNYTIPLITWGSQPSSQGIAVQSVLQIPRHSINNGGNLEPQVDYFVAEYTTTAAVRMPPSYIGVNFTDPADGFLEVNLQTASYADCTGTTVGVTEYSSVYPADPGIVQSATADLSDVDENFPEYFGNNRSGAGIPSVGANDQWHHVLLSWDLGTSNTASGSGDNVTSDVTSTHCTTDSKMWCAVNKVNKSGYDLPAYWVGADDGVGDPNKMICRNVALHAGKHNSGAGGIAPESSIVYYEPAVSFTVPTISTSPISVPGPATVSSESGSKTPVLLIELAELQIFGGVTLDTSNAGNVAAFVTGDGRPEDPAVAQALLGQAPNILLHTSKNWKSGKNTGSGSNLTPTGTIETYDNGPALV